MKVERDGPNADIGRLSPRTFQTEVAVLHTAPFTAIPLFGGMALNCLGLS